MLEKSMAVKLIQILVATAWLDGKVQLEEQQYLQKVAQDAGIADDETLKPLLYGLKPVSKEECYAWVDEYLGAHPTSEACQQLLEAISGLIYSDGDVAAEEAKLLTQIQSLDPEQSEPHQFRESVTQAIQQLYQRWVKN
ncbi:MAG: TerB family tellurite resistance protein [Thermosynechococcaceae cyanobacterium]